MINDEKNNVHNVILEGRKNLTISGVTDVDSFDERCISPVSYTHLDVYKRQM